MPPEPRVSPISVDLLIEARWVLPIAPVNTVLVDHAVAVSSGRVAGIGPIKEMNARCEARERVVRHEHALLPGFVDAHTRAATTLLRGLRVTRPRSEWLLRTLRPAEGRSMSRDFVRDGTELAMAEMLRAGTTAFANTYWFPEEAARLASAARMHASIGLPVTDQSNAWAEGANAHFQKAEQLWDEYKADPWVRLHFASQDVDDVSDQTLARLRRVADELDARVVMERAPLRRMNALGLLRPGFTAIGAVSDADIPLISATGVCVVACVQSDLRLGESRTPFRDLETRHVTIGLGSGDAASAGAFDLLAESRAAALEGLPAAEVLRMATLGGATAIGLGSVCGSIETGKSADLVCFDLNRLACQPTLQVPETLVFAATREQATDVWTSGRAAVSGGRLLAFDESRVAETARKWARESGVHA
jgi:5-methylthioadenosine/S-adenosylhomocysteine deaminase